ncbi:hypothetical protein JMJ77_0001592 [Colletotrichum scovillei]|uniref:Uncharacterized protein n=1 Tax=Colletotrichum scovillei TaxID=1209932 RepID=A0A9P7R7W5_9PEZI|nr:hypothetical protein JMJ77_0001592 [Colletotrichum scovillei]KAG7070001.1 hypothetical protein JMJ76_0001260 [Colletotrichum scovillei]KAG7078251.1 hypothetical protein JMJ78_0001925 [Colletotrichum scovillei]
MERWKKRGKQDTSSAAELPPPPTRTQPFALLSLPALPYIQRSTRSISHSIGIDPAALSRRCNSMPSYLHGALLHRSISVQD